MNNLTITSTKILPIENGIGGCVAIAQLTINDAIRLTGIKMKIINDKKIISYPRNMSNKHNRSYFYPINEEVAAFIADELWAAYDEQKA